MAETETPIVTTETALATSGPSHVLLERWIESGEDLAVKRIESLVRALDKLADMSIRRTYPSDWVIHVSRAADGTILREVGYLQDCGADRAGKVWGIELETPAVEKEDFPVDGTVAYHMSAAAWSKVTGERIERVEGSRWSGDKFFVSRLKDEDDKVDPVDVRKAAYANLHGRAVRALAGLTAVPLEKLKECGLDTTKCLFVGYERGSRGGESAGAAVGSDEPTVAFGRQAGKKPSELEAKDLGWYIGAYQENVADAAKARFKKANQRVLDALLREKEKREQGAAQEKAAGGPAGIAEAPGPAPEGKPPEAAPKGGDAMADGTPRGKLIGDVWALLTGAAGKKAIPLMQTVIAEKFGTKRAALSECTDEELTFVASIPEANLQTVAKGVK